MPLRIALWHNLPSGGGKRALYGHVNGLRQLGHHVESWCPPSADQTYLPLGDLIREHAVPLRETPSHRQGLKGRLHATLNPVVPRLQAMAEHCQACAAEIVRGGFDVLFANSCHEFAVSPIGRFASLPTVLYLQEPSRYLYESLPSLPWAALPATASLKARVKDRIATPARRVQVREEVRNARSYGKILVNSLFSRESIARAYGLDSRVCYLGIDAQQFPWGDAPRANLIVGLGFLHYPKGADRAVRALARVPAARRPDFVWIGNGSEPNHRRAVEELARESGVKFRFLERVSDEELTATLQQSFALLYTPRLEPFGYAPLEANACGLPVVAIAEGGVRETVQDGVNGFLVPNDDPDQLARALLRLMDDPAQTEIMRWRARETVVSRWKLTDATARLESELLAAVGKPSLTP